MSSAIPLAVSQGDKPAQKEVQLDDGAGDNDDMLTDVNLVRHQPQYTGSRSGVATGSQHITALGVPDTLGNFVNYMPSRGHVPGDLHDILQGEATPSLLPRPRVSTTEPSDSLHATQTQRLEQTTLTQQPIAASATFLPRARVAAPVTDLPVPQTPPDRCGVRTPSSTRLPIFDSDSDDGASSPHMAKSFGSTNLKPEGSLAKPGIDSNDVIAQGSPERSRSTSQHPVLQEPGQVAQIDKGLPTMANAKPNQGGTGNPLTTVCTPRHRNQHGLEDTPGPHVHVRLQSSYSPILACQMSDTALRVCGKLVDGWLYSGNTATPPSHKNVCLQGPNDHSNNSGVSFGLTDDMLLPPYAGDIGKEIPEPGIDDYGASAEPASKQPVVAPLQTNRAGPDLDLAKGVASPPETMVKAAPPEPRAHTSGQVFPVRRSKHGATCDAQQGKPARGLKSITTPAEQLRQKDECIADLSAKIQSLQQQVHEHTRDTENQLSAATEAARAASETERQILKAAVAQAKQCLEAAQDSAARREAALQVWSLHYAADKGLCCLPCLKPCPEL